MAEDILGTDILLNSDGDIEVGPNGDVMNTDDYDAVKNAPFPGYYNLVLSLWETISAIKGEYPFQPTFGADIQEFVGTNILSKNLQGIKQRVFEVLESDPRIREVESVDIKSYQNTIYIETRIIAIGKSNPETLIFPKIVVT